MDWGRMLLSAGLTLFMLGACGVPPQPNGVPISSPAPTVVRPDALPAEEVSLSFERGNRRLMGTLALPNRQRHERVPAVVIVHGSGPLSRDGVMVGQLGLGFGFELPVYKSLADALAKRGFAVYRYDKRTCGRFNGCAENDYPWVPRALRETEFTTEAYLGDAQAALDTVACHPAIDAQRLFVVGHSQGGSLVPLLMTTNATLGAGVMLAPPYHPLHELIEQQSERVYWAFATAGQPERAQRERSILQHAARALRHVEAGTHFGEPILGQPPGIWASWIRLSREAPKLAHTLDRPLLVLGGDYDYNVAASEIEAWGDLLGRTHRAPHRVRVLPCVTHALNCIDEPDPTRIQSVNIGREVAPELIDEVTHFLRGAPRRK